MTALNTQTVGQSLTLQCEVTTVRGITSRVDIVWSIRSDGAVLRRINDTIATTVDNSLVYTDSYTISQLRRDDNGRSYQCTGMIISNPQTTASRSITLHVNGTVQFFHHLANYIATVASNVVISCTFVKLYPYNQV